MALSQAVKDQIAQTSVPSEPETRIMLRRFLDVSGFTPEDLAEAIGYSRSAISVFMADKYNVRVGGSDSNSLKLRATLKDFIEQQPHMEKEIEARAALETSDYKAVRRAFYKALDKGLAYCINGDPGVGKTFTLKKLCQELQAADASKNGHGRRVIYVRARWNMGPQDLLRRIADASGQVSRRGQIDQLLRKIRFHFSSRRALIVIDEAQLCNLGCLETVRELLDEPPHFGLIFAGSHDVENKFQHIQMEQWRRRLQNTIVLSGLSRDEAAELVTRELGKVPAKLVDYAIKQAMAKSVRRQDLQTRQPVEYLSAGNLARAIDETKEQLERRKGATA
jgi:DNA transposition AAA+ family ATPase